MLSFSNETVTCSITALVCLQMLLQGFGGCFQSQITLYVEKTTAKMTHLPRIAPSVHPYIHTDTIWRWSLLEILK